ncbi:MAG: DEAD/DEAH box helicase [Suipraeoptans sp.]
MKNKVNEGFEKFNLSKEIADALELLGYDEPTEIQKEVIPYFLAGKNVVCKSQTGSGKTAAFGIPICESIKWEDNKPQALVLEPTRELTVQVREEIFCIGRRKRIKVADVFGGFPIDKQIRTLKQKTHCVVGTPGRVMDHIRRETLSLENLSYLVIDEADLMLDMGFADEVGEILSLVPKTCILSLFSATLETKIKALVDEYISDVKMIVREPNEDQINAITQKIYKVDSEDKYDVFLRILIKESPECCMIFCDTREMVNVLFQKMRRSRIFCGMLHGEMDQRERLKTMDAFKRGKFRFLIATDVAARGIDLEDMTHVINYDFPTGRETYVHRIGRTGRNGKLGNAISIVTEEEMRMLHQVEDYTGWTLPIIPRPEANEKQENAFYQSLRSHSSNKKRKGDKLNKGITKLIIGGGKKSKMRAGDIVGTICAINGIEVSDIGIIDIRDSKTTVEILNDKGAVVFEALQSRPIKGKVRNVKQQKG